MPLDYSDFTPFVRGYVEAMFWTESCTDSGVLRDKTISDLSQDAINRITTDCARFQEYAADLLSLAYEQGDGYGYGYGYGYSEGKAGQDFWLTRNNHGTGFWDRHQLKADGLGDRLSKRARNFGPVFLYVGDDGRIYPF
jgi:hypothetical protein